MTSLFNASFTSTVYYRHAKARALAGSYLDCFCNGDFKIFCFCKRMFFRRRRLYLRVGPFECLQHEPEGLVERG